MERPFGKMFGWLTWRKHLAMLDPYDLSPNISVFLEYGKRKKIWKSRVMIRKSDVPI